MDSAGTLLRGQRWCHSADRAGVLDTDRVPSQYWGVQPSGLVFKAFAKDFASSTVRTLGTFNTSVEAASAVDEVSCVCPCVRVCVRVRVRRCDCATVCV